MQHKKFLAVLLMVSLCLSNITWAETIKSEKIVSENIQSAGERRASSSDASENKKKASPSNAEESEKLLPDVDLSAIEDAKITISLGEGGTAYCFTSYPIRLAITQQTGIRYYLQVKSPDSSDFINTGEEYYFGKTTKKSDSIAGEFFEIPGTYQIRLKDSDDNICSNILSVNVKKIPSIKVTFLHQILSKTYGNADEPMTSIYGKSDFIAQAPSNGDSLSIDTLTNVIYTREPGEDPGSYKILSLKSDQCDDIQISENEYSDFAILKAYCHTYFKKVYADASDTEATINLLDFAYELTDKKVPETVSIKGLTETTQQYFSKAPVADKLAVHFTLKKTSVPYQVDIPLTLEGKYYEYPDDLSLTLIVKPKNLVEVRTEEEIKDYYKKYPFDTHVSDRWEIQPDISKEIPGKLTSGTVQNFLNAFNFIRYIAGIPSDVTNNVEYEEYAQAGTTLLTKVGELTHYPEKPAGVSEEFFQKALEGTSSSNIAWSYGRNATVAGELVSGWMEDSDSSNIEVLGHRRWCLDPDLKETGVGHSRSKTDDYLAMHVASAFYHREKSYDYIPWPAQVMPKEYFKGAWSISLNPNTYAFPQNADGISITLSSQKTGKVYVMDNSCKNKSGKYFNISGSGTGYGFALIFAPGVNFSSDDKITVEVSGLKTSYGADANFQYTVKFFQMGSSSSGGGNSSGGSGGSSGGGSSGGGGFSSGGSSSGGPGGSSLSGSLNTYLPSYVVQGVWSSTADGQWQFADANGLRYTNTWAAVSNPYANTSLGQSPYDWFRFDANGNMLTGWFRDADGSLYYLNTASDGTRGKMVTGWTWIADQTGVQKCYYFNPVSDGYRGKMMVNTVIDGKILNTDGHLVINGTIQIKPVQ